MELRSESVWTDARNAVIDLVCMALLVPVPLPLALWFSMFVDEARTAVTLGSWPAWNSPYVAAARGWENVSGPLLVVLACSLIGGYAAKAPTPGRRLLRAVTGAVVLVAAGIGLLFWDPSGSVARQFD